MKINRTKNLGLAALFEIKQRRWQATQIETMIAEMDRICIDLGRQIEVEETRSRIHDPAHFAYPTYAKAARERRTNIQRSADRLKAELDMLQREVNESANQNHAA